MTRCDNGADTSNPTSDLIGLGRDVAIEANGRDYPAALIVHNMQLHWGIPLFRFWLLRADRLDAESNAGTIATIGLNVEKGSEVELMGIVGAPPEA
jgi:hypothetical protein